MNNQKLVFSKLPHRDYDRHKEICDIVIDSLSNKTRGTITHLSKQSNIPESSICGWYHKWELNKEWRPYDSSVHGIHHRIFTDADEESIADYIRFNFITQGFLFQNKDFVNLASQGFLEKRMDDDEIPDVKFSPKFVTDFKKRNKLSSRRARYRRRPISSSQDNYVHAIGKFIEHKDVLYTYWVNR